MKAEMMLHYASTDDERCEGSIGADLARLRDVGFVAVFDADAATIYEVITAIAVAYCLTDDALIGPVYYRLIVCGTDISFVNASKSSRILSTRPIIVTTKTIYILFIFI